MELFHRNGQHESYDWLLGGEMLWEKQNDWLFWGWEGGWLVVLPYSSRACRQTGQQQQLHWRIWKNWVALCPHFPTGDKTSQSLSKHTYTYKYAHISPVTALIHTRTQNTQLATSRDSLIQCSDWYMDVCDSQAYNPFNFFTATLRHKLLRQNTCIELQMRPRCIFPLSRLNRMCCSALQNIRTLPCSATDAPLTQILPRTWQEHTK